GPIRPRPARDGATGGPEPRDGAPAAPSMNAIANRAGESQALPEELALRPVVGQEGVADAPVPEVDLERDPVRVQLQQEPPAGPNWPGRPLQEGRCPADLVTLQRPPGPRVSVVARVGGPRVDPVRILA